MTRRILVTGGAGFIGSNFVRHVLTGRSAWQVTNLDALTYSGNLANLADLAAEPRYTFVHGDINDAALVGPLVADCDIVVHFAAESHVDRSIADARPFVVTNVLGTQTLLEAVRRYPHVRFVHVSTDEVYGSLPLDRPELAFSERSPIDPHSPYSASKAASDLLVLSYVHTYGIDACVTRCSNNFGPYQFPEKVIPLFVTNLIDGLKVPLYGDGLNVRDWLHVEDHCEALLAVAERGRSGQTYNIGGNNERNNRELTHAILALMSLPESYIEAVPDRPGHDRRYAIDATKIREELGWTPTRSEWPDALAQTVRWYVENPAWWRDIKRGAHRANPVKACD